MNYKEIIKGIINIIENTEQSDIGFTKICNYISENCPELKESEGEKIRKDILSFARGMLKNNISKVQKDKFASWIFWLEKQGQSKKTSIWKHWKDGIAGNGDNIPVFLIKNGLTYSLSPCLSFECDYIELSELDNLMLENQDEQKSVLIIPKFKVGDIIIKSHNSDINKFDQFTITDITGNKYWYNDRIICDINEQNDWGLVEQKPSDKIKLKFHEGDWIEDNLLSSNQQDKSRLHFEQFKKYMKGK